MSDANQIVQTLLDRQILVYRHGEKLRAVALQPGSLTHEIEESLRAHKAELLEFLTWQETADGLLLESTRTIGEDYPSGCPLDTAEWKRQDDVLHAAFWSGDLALLRRTLAERERFARAAFVEYREHTETTP
ncbi:MAG: hypothetical protein WCP21_04090 [Armatimonadota bacterium]